MIQTSCSLYQCTYAKKCSFSYYHLQLVVYVLKKLYCPTDTQKFLPEVDKLVEQLGQWALMIVLLSLEAAFKPNISPGELIPTPGYNNLYMSTAMR